MHIQDELICFVNNIHSLLENVQDLILIKDLKSNCVEFSQTLCHLLKANKKDLVGLTDYDLPWKNFADQYRRCDLAVIAGTKQNTLEHLPIGEKIILTIKSCKSPIVDNNGKIIGIMAQGEILASVNKEFNLTQREIECLFLLIHSNTAKEIANLLNISPRTAESYIDNIKNKMGVLSRSAMISKAIQLGMFEITPKNDMLLALENKFFSL